MPEKDSNNLSQTRGGNIARLFYHESVIDPLKLRFQPFTTDTLAIKSFDCGNEDLNDFLCKDEVRQYEKEQFGKTTLAYYEGELVAYYTISNDQLGKDYIKRHQGFSKLHEYRIEGIPAITIGRLAVQNKWQNKGIGRIIMQKIAMFGLDHSKYSGVRLLLVQAKKEAFKFYEKLGFDYVTETRREKKRFKARGTRTMFFDLKSLNYLRTL